MSLIIPCREIIIRITKRFLVKPSITIRKKGRQSETAYCTQTEGLHDILAKLTTNVYAYATGISMHASRQMTNHIHKNPHSVCYFQYSTKTFGLSLCIFDIFNARQRVNVLQY